MCPKDFRLSVGDTVYFHHKIQFDNSDRSVKPGFYTVTNIGLHPKADPAETSQDSYCYFFSKVKDGGKLGSGFRYNCKRWDELILQKKVFIDLNKPW